MSNGPFFTVRDPRSGDKMLIGPDDIEPSHYRDEPAVWLTIHDPDAGMYDTRREDLLLRLLNADYADRNLGRRRS